MASLAHHVGGKTPGLIVLDKAATTFIKPAVVGIARRLVRAGMHADQMTLLAFIVGLCAALAISQRHYWLGLAFVLLSRSGDALDGAIARLTQTSDRGGFLDITLDFLYYASTPLAFAFADPAQNALAAALLLAAFMGTGSSFLAYAVIAEKRGLKDNPQPSKSFYFIGGLTEATETLICFCAMCLWPAQFPLFATIFSGLCALTIATRIYFGYKTFS